MEGIIQEEGGEATKEDDIEYLIGSLGLVPPSSELIEQDWKHFQSSTLHTYNKINR